MRERARRLARGALRRGDRHLAHLDRGVARRALLAALPRAMPMQFVPAAAEGFDGTIALCVRSRNGGPPARYEIRVARGHCAVRRVAAPAAGTTITVAGAGTTITVAGSDLVRLAGGAAAWPRLMGEGRLEIEGDPFVALRFPALFGLAAAA